MENEPAYILHSRPYAENSAIFEVLTRTSGRVGVMAKMVRHARSKWQGVLQPFTLLSVSTRGKSELKNLVAAELLEPAPRWYGEQLMLGLYLNELLYYLMRRDGGQSGVFQVYREILTRLKQPLHDVELALRTFEFQLLSVLGYGVDFSVDVSGNPILPDAVYWLRPEQLPVLWRHTKPPQEGVVCLGRILHTLMSGDTLLDSEKKSAKQLMRMYLQYYLHGRELKSRALFQRWRTGRLSKTQPQ